MRSLRLGAIITAVVWGVAASGTAAPGDDQAPAPTSAQSSTAPAPMSGPASSRITDTREMVNGAGAPHGPKTAYASLDLEVRRHHLHRLDRHERRNVPRRRQVGDVHQRRQRERRRRQRKLRSRLHRLIGRGNLHDQAIAVEVTALSLRNPLVATYVVAAAVSSVNVVTPWLNARRMMKAKGEVGAGGDVAPSERVQRIQRENLSLLLVFLVVGLLFVAGPPPFWVAEGFLLAYLAAQALYFAVRLMPKPSAEAKLAFRMLGALVLAGMSGWAIAAAGDMIEGLFD